ncbi:MAG: hypothetical protein J6P29_00380 [Acetobacter sp.]|nr:hypothetical protein [Acetobacter sp.]
MPVDAQTLFLIQQRIREVYQVWEAGGYSVIFLCGSVLEAVLTVAIQKDPELFKGVSLKDQKGCDLPTKGWRFVNMIDAAYEVGLLTPELYRYSARLREFRNCIHISEQVESSRIKLRL